jgi:intracellular multiplication protein IcmB
MGSFINPVFNAVDSFFAWIGGALKTTTESYCDIETAEDTNTLVARDGSLVSIIKIEGISYLLGSDEFVRIHEGITLSMQESMKVLGRAFQFFFSYDRDEVRNEIANILEPAKDTATRLHLNLEDLFNERIKYLSEYCGSEKIYLVLWTRPFVLPPEQKKRSLKEKLKFVKKGKLPPFKNTQNIVASFPDIREQHDSLVRSVMHDFDDLAIVSRLLEVHEAIRVMRQTVDPDFTAKDWRPVLPGDKIPIRDLKKSLGDIAGLMWPPLGKQILPRDGENLNLKTCRIGDKVYSSIFIDLFPQDIKTFDHLFRRVASTKIPWRISFFVESGGLSMLSFKSMVAAILSFASSQNRLICDATEALKYINVNTDDAVVKLRVSLSTWAPVGKENILRIRAAELARAVEGWGGCGVSEICGDPFAGAVSSMLGVTTNNVAVSTMAPLSDVVYMLPYTRPSSPWKKGAVLFRSPDGKPWPYQPGSSEQTTWIDLFYARPGSGKSVLSNTINLGLCLAGGIQRLPRVAIIDIGPSSSGLISLVQEALPKEKRHLAAYHKLRMTPDYSINPFDTQLGGRYPTAQERSFLVNFLTLLATPVGAIKPYDGVSDMSGLIVDELYKHFADEGSPRVYTLGIELVVDGILEEIGFIKDDHTTWWEVTDALFVAGFIHEAILAQRYAMPLLADATSICRTQAVEDLYGKVKAPTGEPLITTFGRMISSALREYPILSRTTYFDIGDARIVSLDLDEVAKSGGDAADRQTAVMYMLARYILARHFYLTEECVKDMPPQYQNYHQERIAEIREDAKRLVYDEFHRTSKTQAIRDQVIVDMREGRKWNVQIALISQSLDDFDKVMVEFATSIFIMDAGPAQTVKQSTQVFGLSETAQRALRTRVHGPREGGATFLAQFSTKNGINLRLLTSTIGPIELWSFSTTMEDTIMRNQLYKHLGPLEARRVLANLFPSGSIKNVVEHRMSELKDKQLIEAEANNSSVVDQLVKEVLGLYSKDPDAKHMVM